MYDQKQRRKRVRSRKESFELGFTNYNTRFVKPKVQKEIDAPKYKYAFSENYKPLEKLIYDSKYFVIHLYDFIHLCLTICQWEKL